MAVLLGGLTAHLPGANSACVGFPHCRETLSGGEALAVHVVHRVVAFLLLFHALGLAIGARKRGEAPLVRRLAWAAFGVIVLQILVAAVLVELRLPAVWRSLHQAIGTGVWLATLLLAVVARCGFRGSLVAGTDGPELRRPVAAATAVAMLAVDPASGADAHAAEAWTGQPPAAEVGGTAPSELDDLAAAGIIVVDDATVERSVVALAEVELAVEVVEVVEAVEVVETRASLETEPHEAIAAERAALIAEFGDDVDEGMAHELARIDEMLEEAGDDEELLDANAAALADLERRSSAESPAESRAASRAESREPRAESSIPSSEPAPAPQRPPTLAVIIARGADF